MNNDSNLIFENYLNSKSHTELDGEFDQIEDQIAKVKKVLDADLVDDHLIRGFYDLVCFTIRGLTPDYKKRFIDRLIAKDLLSSKFWDYALDNNLLKEAYKRIDPADNRFPLKPKFRVGEHVLIRKCVYSLYNDNNKLEINEYKDVLAEICRISLYSSKSYYYSAKIVDKRYPKLIDQYPRTHLQSELAKTNLTPEDTGLISGVLDI